MIESSVTNGLMYLYSTTRIHNHDGPACKHSWVLIVVLHMWKV